MRYKIIIIALLFALFKSANAQLPKIQLQNIDGKTISTDKLVDGKNPIIISFFATWCKPCLRELMAIDEVYVDWQDETGVRVIAVSIDNGANSMKVKPLVRSKGWEYEVLLDVNEDFKRALNVGMIPTVLIVNPKGKIVYRHSGYVDGGENKLFEELKKIAK